MTIDDKYDTRFFSDGRNKVLSIAHYGVNPGEAPARAFVIVTRTTGVAASSVSTFVASLDTAIELRGALDDLIEASAPKVQYVVDTSHGAYATYARTEGEALVRAGQWAKAVSAPVNGPIRVGNRVWEVKE